MNILKLIPSLLNKITKNDRNIAQVQKNLDNIDLSPYQLISQKNQANGYIELDSNSKVDNFVKLKPKNKYSITYNNKITQVSASSGAVVYNADPTVNNKLGLSNSYLYSYVALTTNGSSGYCSAINDSNTYNKIALGSSGILYSKKIISINSLTNARYAIVLGNTWMTSTSGSLGGGISSGFAFTYDPSVNSGLWQVKTLISGVTTTYNSTIAPTENQPIELLIIYNKSTLSVSFYINDVLVTTMTNKTISDITTFAQYVCVASTTTASNKIIQLVDSVFELDVA